MDKKIIKGLIDEKLETIQEQFSIIKEYEGKIPVIEIDLVMANIRDLYELFFSLQPQNASMEVAASKPEPVPHPESIKSPAPEPEFNPAAEAEPEPVTYHEPEPEQLPEPDPQTASVTETYPEPERRMIHEEPGEDHPAGEHAPSHCRGPEILSFEPVTDEEPAQENPAENHHRITFDLFSDGSSSTLADRFKSDRDKRIADQLGQDKVLDLRNTIGINDKFLFINELFDGNMRIYDEAVQKLNECGTLAQADLLLLDLKIVYNWDSESPTVKKFVELVRRKF